MRTLLVAATGLPTILLTAALVVVVCFWLLAAVGVARVDSFDTDADLRAWHMGGVPVAVAFSLLTVIAWSLSVGAAVALAVFAPSSPAVGMSRLVVPAGALFAAWATTCLIVRPLHRLYPDEPGPSEPGACVLSPAGRATPGTLPHCLKGVGGAPTPRGGTPSRVAEPLTWLLPHARTALRTARAGGAPTTPRADPAGDMTQALSEARAGAAEPSDADSRFPCGGVSCDATLRSRDRAA